MFGSDKDKMKEFLVDQEILVLTVAGGMVEKDGKTIMDPDLYRDAYVGTAESVVNAIDSNSSLKQIIFTSSLNAYGDGGGADEITEEVEANPLNPFQEVYVTTESLLRGLENDQCGVCIFRTGTIHGPGREWKNQLAQMSGQKIPFDGSSDAMIVHRDDVVRAIEMAINKITKKQLCPSCDRGLIQNESRFCSFCGLCLLKECHQCGVLQLSFNAYCQSCGVKQDRNVE